MQPRLSWPSRSPARKGLRHDGTLCNVFDLTGRLAEPDRPRSRDCGAERSVFAELLKVESTAEMSRTSNGSVLLEDIERLFAAEPVPPEVQAIVRELHRQATKRQE